MQKIQSEIRMIWLMVLIMSAVAAWFLNAPMLTYLCMVVFVMSVIQYVDAIQKPTQTLAEQSHFKLQYTSKAPLYLSSLVAVVGGVMHWSWLVGIASTTWVFFFLRWLRRLEANLNDLHQRVSRLSIQQNNTKSILQNSSSELEFSSSPSQAAPMQKSLQDLSFIEQIKQWIFQGNPVLKVAIVVLVIGVILLLRFATEHWQLSLALKLFMVAVVSVVVTILGYVSLSKNRSFALALEGLGLAGLFLTLFFAYYNHVITSLETASLFFAVIMLITLILSLRQQAIELALMAMMVAYIAPFTLPIREATAIELIAYYFVINLAVVILSTLRPWKMLNQIAFLMTVLIGGSYAFIHGHLQDRAIMTLLVLAHSAIFIWLAFRFSQLLAKSDLEQFKLKPALDIALIFGAPIVSYACIYLMFFQEMAWQVVMSCLFAVVYAVLCLLAKRNQSIGLISQSYFSLMLIFLALIPPILLREQWSVVGWALEGMLIFILALLRHSAISRYLAMGLLVVAGISSLYYLVELIEFPRSIFWCLALSYLAVVVFANVKTSFQQQLSLTITLFLSGLSLIASSLLLWLSADFFDDRQSLILSLVFVAGLYAVLNEILLRAHAGGTWRLPKAFALIPMFIFAFAFVVQLFNQGGIEWSSLYERVGFGFACLFMTFLCLRPSTALAQENEWVSFGILLSLGFASLTLFPSMPFISVVILPLVFAGWSYMQAPNSIWSQLWQAKSVLLLMFIWIVSSQLLSEQAFNLYWMPVLNPFDLISLAMLLGSIWMLLLQLRAGLDRGIVAILMVLSLLWLSSYIVLRALHVYLDTPYNTRLIWENATIQLAFTLLWVGLALISMSLATRKQLRSMWILGASILFIVTLKLVLLDLSHVGTLTRVISFLGAGLVMLMIAYIAPIPETEKVLQDEQA